MRSKLLLVLILVILPLALASCDKYKKICYNAIEPRVDAFAVSVAESCAGDAGVAKELFGKLPQTVCGKKLADALEGKERMSQAQIALIACPIILDAAIGFGQDYLENALRCTKPLDLEQVKLIAKTGLCSLF